MRTLAFALLATMMACGGKHHLEEYRFSQRTLGVSFIEPPVAELKHGWYDVDPGGSALQNVVQAGAKVAKELEARKALSRLDSAERDLHRGDAPHCVGGAVPAGARAARHSHVEPHCE